MENHEEITSKAGSILGIDPGEKRIGLALSDPLGITAQGLETLQVTSPGDAAQKISEIARRVEANAETTVSIETEGEVIGTLPATFEIIGERLKVVA